MTISIVIPAFNEAACIAGCVRSVRASAGSAALEVIVVDNNSTDATAAIAAGEGARVVFERENRIAKARNAGARAARGEWILFIDADSLLSPPLLRAIRARMERPDVAGGGALVEFDRAPLWGRALTALHGLVAPLAGIAGGPCLFIRAEAFRAFGGFREDLYGSEEAFFCRDAAAWGRRRRMRFVVLRAPRIVTSGRRFRLNGAREILRTMVGVARDPRSREACALWYDGRR